MSKIRKLYTFEFGKYGKDPIHLSMEVYGNSRIDALNNANAFLTQSKVMLVTKDHLSDNVLNCDVYYKGTLKTSNNTDIT